MIAVPPPDPSHPTPNPVFHILMAGTNLVRIYSPKHNTGPTTFRRNGPRARFDHHRHEPGDPQMDPDRGIYYAGFKLSCTIAEIFGDTRVIECGDYRLAGLRPTRDLRLLDLRGDGAMRAGSVSALCHDSSHSMAQMWSRYFYETPLFGKVDGLIYHNAHNEEDSVALYERAESALKCEHDIRLDDKRLRHQLLKIAKRLNLICGP